MVIVGGGFTGLWTAYYLSRADPALRIAILEAETVGFGASGRNGGWCSALFPTPWKRLVARSSPAEALRLHREMAATVREVGRVLTAEGIDADYAPGGTVVLARSAPQWRRLSEEVATAHARGLGEDDLRLLDRDEARSRLAATDVVGGTFTPHCAAIHPVKLVRGLADAVERAGVRIHESTRVTAIGPGHVDTPAGRVRAGIVVRATEAWTARLPATRRAIAPVYSLMVATEPLSAEAWESIGLTDRPTFSDGRHVVIYGQRTADGRLAFGGRGAPYHWASRIKPSYDAAPRVHALLRRTLTDLLPQLGAPEFTHAWGGSLGIARDWAASVGLDRSTGQAWAGGYVGDGVGTTNLAGRTLADLITGASSDLTTLPWVDHRSPRWEPEPFRWLGINAGLQAMRLADAEERVTRRPSLVARAMSPLIHG
ncbi:NAD(P)/FAD-dependent oxidoreductase [Nocardioides marmoriginsengisoli]|uniref:NAD(P)/FAD-dependent oxidoreductase n=1 Tax=Nocardioides marmoriginsengisoli TaxID=661483 RepID=UPI001FEB40C6|nr:FAD-binding oxidoreductase [Nocardioides marmoriginsengisoli]